MNKEVAEKWISALRSGKYPQTQKRLHTAKGFCCLGVLCDVAVTSGLDLEVGTRVIDDDFDDLGLKITTYDGRAGMLPERLVEWSGMRLDVGEPFVPYEDSELMSDEGTSLVVLNDRFKLTFNQIADLIEQYWQSL